MGGILHDFYTCMERIFERIASTVDQELPGGPAWHADLLYRMSLNVPNLRIAVIDAELQRRLRDYLRFRHVFRNVYGYDLLWDKFRDLVDSFEETARAARAQVERFCTFLLSTSNEPRASDP